MGRPVSPLSKQIQIDIMKFILSYSQDHAYPPTLREIAEGVCKGITDVSFHINNLKEMGCLTYKSGHSRTYVVTNEGKSLVKTGT